MTVSAIERPVQAQLEAYNARDIDRFAAQYTEDVEIFRLPATEPFVRGRAQVHAEWGATFARHPALHCRLRARTVQGNFVVDHEEVSGLRDDLVQVTAIYQVEGGLIRRVWFLG
ncbi:hypothetical protein HNR42_000556 [Deinobacterium chartae]|uniref:SnoaL-like domain-containing protein n=1 Tax=Deinobacterium chartae TaxID=521158 RepID=A0A841HZ17_9DEIO|nr:nuclear transport factor 2 family protein [Deinobacterium chartae]MBB6097142.1 hypothetical protein [Deinobacterium chartae]